MNNEYEHMEEKTQEGVCFQWDESHEDIVDMNVEAGIKIVEKISRRILVTSVVS